MSIEAAVFYLFAAILVGSAGAVVTVKNPVYAALLLVLAFFTSAAIWLLLEAEFLAITLVLVYVGAVMVVCSKRFGVEHFGEGLKHAADYSNTKELGGILYTVYVYPFEIAAAILLVAIVAEKM